MITARPVESKHHLSGNMKQATRSQKQHITPRSKENKGQMPNNVTEIYQSGRGNEANSKARGLNSKAHGGVERKKPLLTKKNTGFYRICRKTSRLLEYN